MSEAERDVYDAGLIGVLKQLHDDIDAAVAEAYGWPADLSDEQILERLVALNQMRAAEERAGSVRWLRSGFQAPAEEARKTQLEVDLGTVPIAAKARKTKFPTALPDRVAAVRSVLLTEEGPIRVPELARRFSQGRSVQNAVGDILETLALIGFAEKTEQGYRVTE